MQQEEIARLLAMLETAEEHQDNFVPYSQQMARGTVLYMAVVLLGYLSVLVYVILQLWGAWQGGQWSAFWDALRWAWTLFVLLTGGASYFSQQERHVGQAQLVRAQMGALAQPQAAQAPPAADQTHARAPWAVSAGAEQFGPFA